MITTRNTVILLVILGLVAAGFIILRSTPEKQVRKQLDQLVESVDKEPGEPTMTTLTKIGAMGKLFADTCQVTVDRPPMEGEFSRKEVMDRINMARNYFSELHLRLHDVSILLPTDSRAKVLLTLRIHGIHGIHGIHDNEENIDTRELELILDRKDRKWMFSRVKVVEVLEQ